MAEMVPPTDLVGTRDGLERLWTPHRMAYIDSHKDSDDEPVSTPVCPFCAAPGRSDEDALIVHRGSQAYVILNLFPYNPGHLLMCTYRHVADFTDLTDEEACEVTDLTRQSMRVLRAASSPAGFNIGMNQGYVAGAGVAEHLHQHVVPRWTGDANFFPIIAQTKAIPQLLADTRDLLARTWGQA
ncbi:MAG: HIT domain-containing protein [Propionibacteriaceae bacterium]|nr:HIT domain-containing protein [Propionibacteriaceae bacterium]